MLTAVSKPKVKSVALRSLSMVLGTPTTLTPRSCSLVATPSVSSPPIATSASTPRSARLLLICSTPPSTLNGLVREEPRMVPPRGRMPRTCGMPSSVVIPSSGPFQPSRKPTNSKPYSLTPLRTTARMTAFRPGQSPPPVRTPTRMRSPGVVAGWSMVRLERSYETVKPATSSSPRRVAGVSLGSAHEHPRDRCRHHGRDRARGDRPGHHRRPGVPGVPAALPQAGLGGALAGGDLAGHARGRARVPRRLGRLVQRARGRRYHEPARDGAALGPGDPRVAPSRDRVAGPAYGRDLPQAARRGPRGPGQRADGAATGPVLLRHQADLAGRERAERLGPGEGG